MTELETAQQRIAELEHSLARCRDAFHAPPTGSELDDLWRSAMAGPDGIPAFVEAAMRAGGEPVAYVSSIQSGSPLMCNLTDWEKRGLEPLYTHQPAAQDAEDARRFRAVVEAVIFGDDIFQQAGIAAAKADTLPETIESARRAIDAAIAAQQGEKT